MLFDYIESSSNSYFYAPTRPNLLHGTCATCSELPSYMSTMVEPINWIVMSPLATPPPRLLFLFFSQEIVMDISKNL